ncbi:coiled-coil-helix-coiled-coil-helix domain containing 6b isoform X3 [Danio rerio]|uniref:Coiled-coil-helix-coiled-coil-helix domain containing 6b isoform X3 n=1 Tax=Danio rerio TaxID=7955 RepID=A0AC58JR96_DANRE
MGAADSRSRSVSFGLDEKENVTVLHGVKLSGEVLQRMRESGPASSKPASNKAESAKAETEASRASAAETQEELKRRFEREQVLVQEELSRISQRERESAADEQNTAVLREKTQRQLNNTHNLARQLKKKENELKHLEQFYKEQLQLMEKKVLICPLEVLIQDDPRCPYPGPGRILSCCCCCAGGHGGVESMRLIPVTLQGQMSLR